MGQVDVQVRGARRVPRDAAVGARKRLPVGRVHVLVCGEVRAAWCAAVGARERVPLGLSAVHVESIGEWPPGRASVVEREPSSTGTVRERHNKGTRPRISVHCFD